MEIILLEKVAKLGMTGDIVNVKPGFARNFLIPHSKALRATSANKKLYETKKKELEVENIKKIEEANEKIIQIDGKFVIQIRQAGEDGRLFGSVSSKDIADSLAAESKVDVKRNQIFLNKSIKYIGVYEAIVMLHPEVSTKIMVNVARSASEAAEAKKIFLNPPKEEKEVVLPKELVTELSVEDKPEDE